ncbi:hypothetical protein LQ567_22280 [Niabella pedocola]|uniref:Uncharacterized protein n=1 Tax=Niabella pedocola TaxID=1752077 RepID=A0ABS8PYW9_9BACT|nr:hypothetical protein [Niabella pedocola]MCD2425528.1 hypothetical protein [Niabella pedocola]
MVNIRSSLFLMLLLAAVTRLYACAGQTEENKNHPAAAAAQQDTMRIRLENPLQYNTVAVKNNAVTNCATTEKNCKSDVDFITAALQLLEPAYKATQLEAIIYQGTAVLNNAGRDSLKTTYYLIKTENTGTLQQLITRLDTAKEGYVRRMAKTEAPIACYFATTPNEVLLITHIGVPEFQKLKNQPLVAAVKKQVGGH